MACVPVVMAVMVVYVVIRRRTKIPDQMTNWLFVYVLYQSSELSAGGVAASLVPALLVLPAAVWTYLVCFHLWPGRGEIPPKAAEQPGPLMSVSRHATCAALAAGVAATVAFMLHLSHVNWAIWSSITNTFWWWQAPKGTDASS